MAEVVAAERSAVTSAIRQNCHTEIAGLPFMGSYQSDASPRVGQRWAAGLESRSRRYRLRIECGSVRTAGRRYLAIAGRRESANSATRCLAAFQPFPLGQLYRQDTRARAGRPRPITDRTVRVLLPSAAGKLTVKVALSPGSKNTSERFCQRSIRGMSHATHPRATCGKQSARQLTGPDLIEPRIGSTGVDAEPWNPPQQAPPVSDSRHFKVPLTPVLETCSA
jgi:hypothetical protein